MSRSIATSSADVMRTGRSSTAPSAWVEAPKPPKTTFTIDRFIARHMNTDSRKPDEPSRAPARIRIGLWIANPSAAPERPANEFKSEMIVGMSAPPIRITNSTPNASPITIRNGRSCVEEGDRVSATTSARPAASTARFIRF